MENENKNKKKRCWIAIIIAFLAGLIVDLVVNRFGGYKAVSSKAVNAVKNIGGSKNEAPVQQPQPQNQYNPQPQQAQQGYNNNYRNGGKFNNNYNNK